jgi:DNA-binding transcriptional regulator YiaG
VKLADESALQRLFRLVTGRTPDVLTRGPTAKVQELRAARPGASNADLARELRVNPQTLRRWEKGTQAPRGRNARRLDRQMRKAMTDQPAKKFREGGKLSFKARVTIGTETRTRTFNLPLSEADRAKLAQAAASNDPEAVDRVLGPMIADYIGQSRGYRVRVLKITQNFDIQ